MTTGLLDLPDDIGALRALVLAERTRTEAGEKELAERDARIGKYEEQVAKLEHRIAVLSKLAFGPKTVKMAAEPVLPAGQQWLPYVELLAAAQRVADREGAHGTVEVEVKGHTRKPTGRRSEFPEHLPRVKTTFEFDESDRICRGQPMKAFGEECASELERVEVVYVHEIARTK